MGACLTDLVDSWIVDSRVRSRRGFSDKTEQAYRNDLALFANTLADIDARPVIESDEPISSQALERITVSDFTDANLAQVFSVLIDQGKAASSRGRMLSALRGFCGWCVKHGHISQDPTTDFETPQVSDRLPVAFNVQELQRIFSAASAPPESLRAHWPKRDVAMVATLAGCGLRSAELCGLSLASIERAEPMKIRVTGKGNKDRVVPISAEIVSSIDDYLTERRESDLGGADQDDVLFVRKNGSALNNQALQNLVDNWLTTAGVSKPPGEKAHAFRHTYAVSQLSYGTNPAELQALLGHKNLSTTSQYLRLSAEGLHHTSRATAVNTILGELGA